MDYDTFGRLVSGLVDAGNDAVVVTGTTGESPVLSDDERFNLYREALTAVGDRALVIAGTGGYDTTESVAFARSRRDRRAWPPAGHALLQQAAAGWVGPPLRDHRGSHVAANMLYNVPARTSLNMTADTVARLSAVDNIVAVKEASGDFDQIAEIARTAEDGFDIYSGNDSDTYLLMALGGVGVVSVQSHVVSGETRDMIDAFVEGDLETARRKHLHLLPIARALFPAGWSNPIAVKAALNLSGFQVGVPRSPLVEMPAAMQDDLKAVLDLYELDAFIQPAAVHA